MKGPLSRQILMLGGALFAAYGLLAIGLTIGGYGQDVVAVAGGVMAYVFLAAAAVLWLRERRRRHRPDQVARRFLSGHQAVVQAVGAPVKATVPDPVAGGGRGAGQATVWVDVEGSFGDGRAEVVLARLGSSWEVLRADLVVDGDHVPLTSGARAH